MRIKIQLKSVMVYALYAACTVCINYSAGGAPLSAGLCFAMLACGANLFAAPAIYVLSHIPSLDWKIMLLALFEGAFLCAVTAIYRRAHRRIKYEYIAYMAVALAPFVAFSPWNGLDDIYFTDNQYVIKAVAAAAAIIFSLFCLKAVYALFYRLCRCRLRSEELICIALAFTVTGIGFYNLCGLYACLAAGIALTVSAVRLYRDPTAVAVACVLGLPLLCTTFSATYMAVFCLLSCACLLFCGAGRYAPSAAALAGGALYFYFDGAFSGGAAAAAINGALLAACCVLPAAPSEKFMRSLLGALRLEPSAPAMYEDRLRARTSDRLFATAQVFREIENAFDSLDEAPGDDAMLGRALGEMRAALCRGCERRDKCAKSNVYDGFARLMHSGRIKGRVSLVDLPAEITVNCARPADVMAEANAALGRLKRRSAEAENARNGRLLLANQARGIAEVLKSAAVDIARGSAGHAEREKLAARALADAGICCSEVKISGDDGDEVYVTADSAAAPDRLKAALCAALGKRLVLKDKFSPDGQRTCRLYVRPPDHDAAFGAAFAVKDGEQASGDTHSVIKINEHCFLMALCDGMGSGPRARSVSSTTISLVEAFFRAEMPSSVVLETINKLMSYSRDETFTCMDIAAVDLGTLRASFIKIGSPAGIIIKRDGIKVMESNSLPLGILESIRPSVCEERLEDGDIVVFMSDGIASAFPSATDMYAFLEELKPLNPQNLADNILARAKKAAGDKCPDDMTVLCVRIFTPE